MRMLIVALLITTTAAGPLLAQERDRQESNATRDVDREARPERQERRAQRAQAQAQAQAAAPVVVQPRGQGGRDGMRQDGSVRQGGGMRQGGFVPGAQPAFRQNGQNFRGERRDDHQDFRQERRDDRQGFREERRDDRQDLRNGQTDRQGFRQDRRDDRQDFRRDRVEDRRDFRQDRREDRRDWNRGWRGDQRYNWQDWRLRNRGIFRQPRYYAPYGWGYGYRRFSIGISLNAALFGRDYWIDDPFYYRLPPAYGSYRWVRYYNDVLLVDTRDGQVVDVIYDFFY